jgi:hypothetical protein
MYFVKRWLRHVNGCRTPMYFVKRWLRHGA